MRSNSLLFASLLVATTAAATAIASGPAGYGGLPSSYEDHMLATAAGTPAAGAPLLLSRSSSSSNIFLLVPGATTTTTGNPLHSPHYRRDALWRRQSKPLLRERIKQMQVAQNKALEHTAMDAKQRKAAGHAILAAVGGGGRGKGKEGGDAILAALKEGAEERRAAGEAILAAVRARGGKGGAEMEGPGSKKA